MKKWILSLVLLVGFSAFAGPGGKGGGSSSGALGGNSGGGGTFVETPDSRTLVFWDLFIHDPKISDNQPGDRLALRPRRLSPSRGNIGDWIDYRELKSFGFLKSRLRKWKLRVPNLISVITATGNGDMLEEPKLGHPGNLPGYYTLEYMHRYHFLIAATSLHIQDFDEIEVPSNIGLAGVRAYPTAFYRASNEVILINMNNFNRAGLKSQAALLLHEKMRKIQTQFKISNAQLQKLVYNIIAREPETVVESELNDRLFAPNNGSRDTGDGTRVEMTYYEFEKGFDCLYTPAPIPCMKEESVFYFNNLITQNSDPMTADAYIQSAVKEGTLGAAPSEARLRSTGKYIAPLVDSSPAPTVAAGVILNKQNCEKVYEQHKLGASTRLWYGQAPCNDGFYTFNHTYVGMAFTTPIANEFNLQVEGATYSGNDGGSEFRIEAMGIKIQMHNQGVLYIYGDRNQFIGSALKLDGSASRAMHKYVFRFLFTKRRIDVVLNDNGKFRDNPALASWNMPDYVPATLSKVSWKIELFQNVHVQSIEVLPAPLNPLPEGDVFENWKEKNKSGVNYISGPSESCRTGYRSIFLDPISRRRECESIPAYFPKPGEGCAEDFLSLKEHRGRRICQNSRIYPEYWPMHGDQCAPGYTDVGFDMSPGFDDKTWRRCVDTKRVDRYVIYNPGVRCDFAFRSKQDSWNARKWTVCTKP
jgi:hypothetical protein